MIDTLLQTFIKANPQDWKTQLVDEYGINIREYDDRTTFNYDQLNSPKMDPMVQECRGLILRNSDWSVMARSFDRFFNLGEANITEKVFSIQNATAFEKLDGSLITVYHDGENWCASTRGMAFAEGKVRYGDGSDDDPLEGERTFADVIRLAFGKSLNDEMEGHNVHASYVFELTSPFNRVVNRYSETKMTLLTIRRNNNGEEFSPELCDRIAQSAGWNRPKVFSFGNLNEIMATTKHMSATEEGYVLAIYNETTSMYQRVKVKNPSYLAIAHMRSKDGLNPKSIIKLVYAGDELEYLTYHPEDAEDFKPYQAAFKKMMEIIDTTWQRCKTIEDQKEFATAVKGTGIPGVFFQMRKGIALSDILDRMTDNNKIQTLNKFKE